MRFELSIALKYLIPRWRQFSVSIISLISVLVISLVVWLVVLFLSVTDGIEKKWIEQLVALNAPIRMSPTEAYYNSYYYQIDSASATSNYTLKTIAEKRAATKSDPYNKDLDAELPHDFPEPDRHSDGSLKDPVKEAWKAVESISSDFQVRAQEYEVSFGNLHLAISQNEKSSDDLKQSFITQISYLSAIDGKNKYLQKMTLPPSAEDYNHLLHMLFQTRSYDNLENAKKSDVRTNLQNFFNHLNIRKLKTNSSFVLTPSLFPESGKLLGVGIVHHDEIGKIIVPRSAQDLKSLEAHMKDLNLNVEQVEIIFDQEQMHVSSETRSSSDVQVVLANGVTFNSRLNHSSLENASSSSSLEFQIEGYIQEILISGSTRFENLEIAEANQQFLSNESPFWQYIDGAGCSVIPFGQSIGEGILVSKNFQSNGIRIGDRGYISYYVPTMSSRQEQRVPVYVAGFYDPGLIPIGNKLLFMDSKALSLFRGNIPVSDSILGNGINLWIPKINKAESAKRALIEALKEQGIDKYWDVQSFHDYEFSKPILQQLRSDKNIFTLVAIIILIVACSNVISMLILLVNDKKYEIAVFQSMGASATRVATIFGICGSATGLCSCIVGTCAALFTLRHLQGLVNFLSFLQGHEAFQAAFYGSKLPNELSVGSLLFVIAITMISSMLAGTIPAAKASRVRPVDILRAE